MIKNKINFQTKKLIIFHIVYIPKYIIKNPDNISKIYLPLLTELKQGNENIIKNEFIIL